MRGSLLEVLVENERQANRSCAIAGLWTAAIAGYAKLRDYRGADSAWSRYQKDNPGAEGPGIFESLYIGAYALLYDGLLTCQGPLYRKYFETLIVIEP